MRRWLVRFGVLLVLPLSGAALYWPAALVLGQISTGGEPAPGGREPGIFIQIVSNGTHVDIVVPVVTVDRDWRQRIDPTLFPAPVAGARTIAFGWGHREFYLETPTWADFDPLIGARAVVGIGETAMHVSYWPGFFLPSDQVVSVRIGVPAYRRLLAYIDAGFRRGAGGELLPITGYSYTGNDIFYAARGSYNLFNTCNEWARRAIVEAGVPVGLWAPFAGGLLEQLRDGQAVSG